MITAFLILLLIVFSIAAITGIAVTSYIVIDNRNRRHRRAVRQAQENVYLTEMTLKKEILEHQRDRVIEARIRNDQLPAELDPAEVEKKAAAQRRGEVLPMTPRHVYAPKVAWMYEDIDQNV